MERDAFLSRLGYGQGRIIPQGIIAPSGDYVFVLGDDEPGRFFELDIGDHAEVTQDTDLTPVDLIRAYLRLRVPNSLQDGFAWEVSLLVDGSKLSQAICLPGHERTITDVAANVSKLTGVHNVGVRLELVVT
jgi:hypothetical protein